MSLGPGGEKSKAGPNPPPWGQPPHSVPWGSLHGPTGSPTPFPAGRPAAGSDVLTMAVSPFVPWVLSRAQTAGAAAGPPSWPAVGCWAPPAGRVLQPSRGKAACLLPVHPSETAGIWSLAEVGRSV